MPGLQIDTELNAIKIFLDLLLTNVKKIQRDDGALVNEIVGLDQVAPEVAFGLNDVSDWVGPGTQYFQLNGVWYNQVLYRCLVDHISDSDFDTDLAAGRWVALVSFVDVLADGAAAQLAAEVAQGLSEDARDAAVVAQTSAEQAVVDAQAEVVNAQAEVVNAQTEVTNAQTEVANAAAQAALAAGSAADALDSENAAAQSELDVAAAIAALVDPTLNPDKLLRSDGSTYVASAIEEDEFGNVETFGNLDVGNNIDAAGSIEAAFNIEAGARYRINGLTTSTIIQTSQFTDGGSARTSTAYGNMLTSSLSITPLRDDTRLIFWIDGEFRIDQNAISPYGTCLFARNGSTLGNIVPMALRAALGSNSNLVQAPLCMVRTYDNSSTAAASYNIRAQGESGTTVTIAGVRIVWMEVLR